MDKKPSLESLCIRDLLLRKKDLERTFDRLKDEGGNGIHPHAYYAYTNVIKALVEISRTSPPEKADPEVIRRRARHILETEYGIKRG